MNQITIQQDLEELASLPRQSVCFQFLMLLNLAEKGIVSDALDLYQPSGERAFFSSTSLRDLLGSASSKANATKALLALDESGFVERVVIDDNGERISTPTFRRNQVTIYYRLSDRGIALFNG